MSNLRHENAGRLDSRKLLARLLDAPDLARQVSALPVAELSRVIERVGLEDAGEIVALASTSQLVGLFDEDVWSNDAPGEDERFDAARFSTWLSVLLEAGEAFAAARVAELSLDFVTLAFSRLLLVLNVDALIEAFDGGGDEVDQIEKALSNCLCEELDEFQLVARRSDGWDDVLSLILALDREHRPFLRQVLEHCAALSSAYVEENGGLYEVLSDEEMLEGDARGEREDRRAAMGHLAPAQAKAFLRLALSGEEPEQRDAVTRAYFRELVPTEAPARAVAAGRRIERLLGEAKPKPAAARAKAKPAAPRSEPSFPSSELASSEPSLLTRALATLASEDAAVAAARREELAYLANVLIAGAPFEGRRFRPVEALEAAIAVTNLGLEMRAADASEATRVLREVAADVLFRSALFRLRRELPESDESVPRVAGAPGLGFVSSLADLERAKPSRSKRKGDQRNARVNGSSQ